MIKQFIKLNQIKSSNQQKVFVIDGNTYYANVELEGVVDSIYPYNFSGYVIKTIELHDIYVNSLYPAEKTTYKSNLYKVDVNNRINTSRDHVDTYLDDKEHILGMVQLNDFIYMLTDKNSSARKHLDADLNSILLKNNGKTSCDSIDVEVDMYDKSMVSRNLTLSCINGKCYGIKYNKVLEINGNIENDYNSGVIYASTLKCRNEYNAEYSTPCSSDTESYLKLDECRQYTGIGYSGNNVFLKYYDNVHYTGNYDKIEENRISCYVVNIQDNQQLKYNSKLLNIESIESISRSTSVTKIHPSPVYSLLITIPALSQLDDEDKEDQKIKETIKLEIENYIRTIALQLMPVHSLLFKVNIIEL